MTTSPQIVDLVLDYQVRFQLLLNAYQPAAFVWWDLEEYCVQRIDYYDRTDTLLKTLPYHGYHEYGGEYWRPDRMVMVNHQNGKNTELRFEKWEVAAGADDSQFTASRLRRAR